MNLEKIIFHNNEKNEALETEANELKKYIGKNVKLHGCIYKIRKMSGFAFVLLQAKRQIIQCIYSSKKQSFP